MGIKTIYNKETLECRHRFYYCLACILFVAIGLTCNHGPSPNQKEDEKATDQVSHNSLVNNVREITDAAGRKIIVPGKVQKVICSGSGCLRLLTYLNAHSYIVAVDGIEVKGSPIDARPYAIANPRLKTYPVFGEFRGYDNPELIAGLNPQPEVIFKMLPGGGISPDMLTNKTGIPVVSLIYGNLTYNRHQLNSSLRIMGDVTGKKQRAEEVIAYIDSIIIDLKKRSAKISPLTCYIGGLGQSGPHGIQSTDPAFAPFAFLGLKNLASQGKDTEKLSYLNVAKEQLVIWDPDVIFIDISTLRLGSDINALSQLRDDPSFEHLKAVKNNRIYSLFPNSSYNQNFEVVLANSYFIGKIVFPEAFSDIEPMEKAEEISEFLNGGPAFAKLNEMFGNKGFKQMALR
ncbi:MAG: ABC transporter substrate-binding protein [Prolixibacteraceae bacterium]|nr:ABC transporter substrate-binding protein [Prolixibacteraceae bacterium]